MPKISLDGEVSAALALDAAGDGVLAAHTCVPVAVAAEGVDTRRTFVQRLYAFLTLDYGLLFLATLATCSPAGRDAVAAWPVTSVLAPVAATALARQAFFRCQQGWTGLALRVVAGMASATLSAVMVGIGANLVSSPHIHGPTTVTRILFAFWSAHLFALVATLLTAAPATRTTLLRGTVIGSLAAAFATSNFALPGMPIWLDLAIVGTGPILSQAYFVTDLDNALQCFTADDAALAALCYGSSRRTAGQLAKLGCFVPIDKGEDGGKPELSSA